MPDSQTTIATSQNIATSQDTLETDTDEETVKLKKIPANTTKRPIGKKQGKKSLSYLFDNLLFYELNSVILL